jgi:hypothetical protein
VRRASRAIAPMVAAFAVLLLPRLADACPMCASRQPGGAVRVVLLGLMILLPFAIAFIVVRALRRAGALPTEEGATGSAATHAASARASGKRVARVGAPTPRIELRQ